MSEFVRYEVVRTSEISPLGASRYHVYGFRPDGVRVSLDQLYLRDHDEQITDLEARCTQLQQERDRYKAECGSHAWQFCPDCGSAVAENHDADKLARIAQLPRYAVSEIDGMLLPEPTPDGSWIPWVDLQAILAPPPEPEP